MTETEQERSNPSFFKRLFFFCVVVFLFVLFLNPPVALSQSAQDEEWDRAFALLTEGQKRYDLSDFHGAIQKWEQALSIAKRLNRGQETIHTIISHLGSAYGELDDYRKAIRYFEQALAISEGSGDKKSKGADLGNLGNPHYRLGDYWKAIAYYEQALAIAKEVGDKKAMGNHLGNLGVAYEKYGDYRKAISYGEQALTISEESGSKRKKSIDLNNLGNAYHSLGDMRKAISYHEQALAISEEIQGKKAKGGRLTNLGGDYEQLGDYRKAISYHEQALTIAEEIGDKRGKGIALHNLGLAYRNIGDYGKATFYFEQAIVIDKQIGVSYDLSEGNLSEIYLALDRDDEALAIFIKQNQSIRLGRYYLKKKNFRRAKVQFDMMREEHERNRSSAVIPEWIGLGLSHEGLKEYDKAYTWYAKAIDFMEDQRAALTPDEREHYFEGKVFAIPRMEAYEGAVRCAFMLGRIDDAFFWAENTRGRMLSELLSRRHAGENYKIPSKLAQEEEDLVTVIMINKKQQQTAFQKNNPELLKQAESEYSALKQKMEALIAHLRKEYPQYAAVKYPQPVKLFQLALRKGETIIEYEVTNPYTMGFVIRDGRIIKGFKVDKTRAELESLVRKFRSPFQSGQKISEFNMNLAKELTDLLIGPALSEISKGEHLVIIPDEALSLLPFESLLLSEPSNVKVPIYVIDIYPISYYQSASVLSLQRGLRASRVKKQTFFGLGDPVFDTQDQRSTSMRAITIAAKKDVASFDITDNEGTKKTGYQFGRLENTGKEVREVSSLFSDSRVLIGLDASKDNLKKEDLTTRRYVLFSTHGILGNEIPYIKQPALVLNLVGNKEEEGFLTTTEIFNMSLNADLVGLSACQTGLGIQSAGEGVVGLSRAFMYAGTDSVLVSLWSVSDESTYKLMVRFFEGLTQGKDKLTALKEAKQYLRTTGYDNPFYWAPFILVGEAN